MALLLAGWVSGDAYALVSADNPRRQLSGATAAVAALAHLPAVAVLADLSIADDNLPIGGRLN